MMRSIFRILLSLTVLVLMFVNKEDEKVLKKNLIYKTESTTLDDTKSNLLIENIRLGIKKQSLLRLEQSVGEQRDL